MQNNINRHFTSVNLNEKDTNFKVVMALFKIVVGHLKKRIFLIEKIQALQKGRRLMK